MFCEMTPDELRAWRDAHGLTQTQLGQLLGVQRNTITRWETGDRTPPPGRILDLALTALAQEITAARTPPDG